MFNPERPVYASPLKLFNRLLMFCSRAATLCCCACMRLAEHVQCLNYKCKANMKFFENCASSKIELWAQCQGRTDLNFVLQLSIAQSYQTEFELLNWTKREYCQHQNLISIYTNWLIRNWLLVTEKHRKNYPQCPLHSPKMKKAVTHSTNTSIHKQRLFGHSICTRTTRSPESCTKTEKSRVYMN